MGELNNKMFDKNVFRDRYISMTTKGDGIHGKLYSGVPIRW